MKDRYRIYDYASRKLIAEDYDRKRVEILRQMYMYKNKGCEIVEYRISENNRRHFVNSYTN